MSRYKQLDLLDGQFNYDVENLLKNLEQEQVDEKKYSQKGFQIKKDKKVIKDFQTKQTQTIKSPEEDQVFRHEILENGKYQKQCLRYDKTQTMNQFFHAHRETYYNRSEINQMKDEMHQRKEDLRQEQLILLQLRLDMAEERKTLNEINLRIVRDQKYTFSNDMIRTREELKNKAILLKNEALESEYHFGERSKKILGINQPQNITSPELNLNLQQNNANLSEDQILSTQRREKMNFKDRYL